MMNHLPILMEMELRQIQQQRQKEAEVYRRGSFSHEYDNSQPAPPFRVTLARRMAALLARVRIPARRRARVASQGRSLSSSSS